MICFFIRPLAVRDFGLQGQRPVQRDLLDWLAVDFMEHGWSLRHLLRHLW